MFPTLPGRPRGEEEEEGPSRADEADKWRRKDAPMAERRSEEMPGRSYPAADLTDALM